MLSGTTRGPWRLPLLLLIGLVAGCGGPTLVPVRGKILRDGEPLPRATLIFSPISAGSRPASGTADADGRYAATTDTPGDGLAPGEYRIAVHPAVVPEVDGKGRNQTRRPLPPKYADPGTSGLCLTIEPGAAPKQFDVDVKD